MSGADHATAPTPVLVSWSGGKDAAWMLHVLQQSADWAPMGLLCTLTEGTDRVAMQGISRSVLALQATAAQLPLLEWWLPSAADNVAYEARFAAALEAARSRWPALRHVAFGDLALADVRAWREALCARHGVTAVFPLFGEDTAALGRRMIAAGLRATVCCVDTTLLDAGFAGIEYDGELLARLPAGVDPCGENGEFHTCVHAGPMFALPLRLQRGKTLRHGDRFVVADLLP